MFRAYYYPAFSITSKNKLSVEKFFKSCMDFFNALNLYFSFLREGQVKVI